MLPTQTASHTAGATISQHDGSNNPALCHHPVTILLHFPRATSEEQTLSSRKQLGRGASSWLAISTLNGWRGDGCRSTLRVGYLNSGQGTQRSDASIKRILGCDMFAPVSCINQSTCQCCSRFPPRETRRDRYIWLQLLIDSMGSCHIQAPRSTRRPPRMTHDRRWLG